MSIEKNVQERYAQGAKERQQALCCPVSYQTELLELLPQEIIDRDYGCGDPSRYVQEGDTVLDLGSGGGKICYMAAQLVGEFGHVHGVDMTDDMLQLARSHQRSMAEKIGQDRVSFHKGYIQNLAFSMETAANFVKENPIVDSDSVARYEDWKLMQQKEEPMIASGSISLVISNCVLNLVGRESRNQLFEEIFRVLKPGGRVAISDIISDEFVPQELQNDPELWSGCISGAFQEEEFLQVFVDAGFVNVAYDKWDAEPWQTVEGIEFRSVTLVATKPLSSEKTDAGKALMYTGPYQSVTDDLGNVFRRGRRTAVSTESFDLQLSSSQSEDFVSFGAESDFAIRKFCKPAGALRAIKETKFSKQPGTSCKPKTGGCC